MIFFSSRWRETKFSVLEMNMLLNLKQLFSACFLNDTQRIKISWAALVDAVVKPGVKNKKKKSWIDKVKTILLFFFKHDRQMHMQNIIKETCLCSEWHKTPYISYRWLRKEVLHLPWTMLSLTEVIHKLSVVTSTSTIFQNFPFIGIIAADRSLLPEIFLGVFYLFFFFPVRVTLRAMSLHHGLLISVHLMFLNIEWY